MHEHPTQDRPGDQAAGNLRLAVMFEGGLWLAAVVLAWMFGIALRDQLIAHDSTLLVSTVRGLVATLPMLAGFWWLVRSRLPALRELRGQVEWLLEELFPRATLGQFALVAALAGIGEELLFRGVAQHLVARWTTPVVAVAIAGLLFGLAHAMSRLYFLLATMIGCYFGWLLVRYDLTVPIVAHAVYDFVALVYLSRHLRHTNEREPPEREAIVETITCQKLHELSRGRPIELIDVRTPEEYQAVRATPARNVPLDVLDPAAVIAERASGAQEPLYFICKMGIRSATACQMFLAAGYRNVLNVDGGTDAWLEAGLPVEQGPDP